MWHNDQCLTEGILTRPAQIPYYRSPHFSGVPAGGQLLDYIQMLILLPMEESP